MKILIATALIALTSSVAFASSDMNDEFYDGLENSSIVTAAASNSDNLYLEGNIVDSGPHNTAPEGIEIGHSLDNASLHLEGNIDV